MVWKVKSNQRVILLILYSSRQVFINAAALHVLLLLIVEGGATIVHMHLCLIVLTIDVTQFRYSQVRCSNF